MEKLILIDGNSLVNRAYYALPPLTNPAGEPVQAVYGFATMLIKAIEDISPNYIAVAFDLHAPTFRHKEYAGYKANRKGMPDQLASQMPILKRMLGIMGIRTLECEGFEADDIIGTMAKRNKVMTYIITGDRDSLQLIDESTSVLLNKRGITDMLTVDEAELERSFGLTPAQVVEYKALAGDSSDNIPGVPGVGEKTAMTLLRQFGDVESVYAKIDEVTPATLRAKLIAGRESAVLSHRLATIDTQMNLPCALEECEYVFPFLPEVRTFFAEQNFKSLLKRDDVYRTTDVPMPKSDKPVCDVRVIRDFETLECVVSRCKGTVAFALGESVNLAFDLGEEYVINLAYSFVDDGLDIVRVMNTLKGLLCDRKTVKIVYDAKQLKHQLFRTFHLDFDGFFDVKLAQYLADATVDYATLPAMLKLYGLDETEPATGLIYLRSNLEAELEKLKMHRLYYDVELPLVDILYGMEREGFCVDLNKLNEQGQKFTAETEVLTRRIYELAGQEFNIKSPKQLSKVLFEDLKIPYPKWSSKKASVYSTGADVLEAIEPENPIVSLVLKFRFVTKLNSTYIEGLRKLVDGRGVVHTEFRQMLTTTGRLSSAEPNLQNIPIREEEGKALRAVFVAREGRTLVSADYSQIELRLMAHMSQDPIMIAAYRAGEDIHTQTAAEVFGVAKEAVTPAMRREAKAVNFGIIYGISDYGLAANLKIPRAQAKKYIERYFDRFSGVKSYLDNAVAAAKKTGAVCTLLGRIRKIPELFSSSYTTRQFGERAAMNMPLQGSAADIIKIAMINVHRALEGMKSKLVLQIHDELIVDATDDEVEAVKKILKEKMTGAMKLDVPLTAEVGEGKSWLECK